MNLLIIPYMALMAGWSGGSIWGSKFFDKIKATWLPELLFACGVGYVLFPIIGFYALIAIAWSYLWMQTGHANALNWGRKADPNRSNTLTTVVDWLSKVLGVQKFSRGYSGVFFGIKGLLIGLPVGGFVTAILWPLAYDIGVITKRHWVSEVLSGALLGLWLYIFTLII